MTTLKNKLLHEPVAFYGGLLSALLVLLAVLGVPADLLATIGTIATLLGIPVTRSRVTPVSKTGPGDAGAGELRTIVLMAAGILLALVLWSLIGVHTDLY